MSPYTKVRKDSSAHLVVLEEEVLRLDIDLMEYLVFDDLLANFERLRAPFSRLDRAHTFTVLVLVKLPLILLLIKV